MLQAVKVKLRKSGRILSCQARGLDLRIGKEVMVKGEQGEEFGEVMCRQELTRVEDKKPLKIVERIATPEDKKRLEENKLKEEKAFQACLKKIEDGKIPMKLIDTEYSFDQSRITFYFIAEERVDFRELVKDLAQLFKARIEMRQVGTRDEARRLGGYGCCGRPLCCATFLKEFEPVTIKMAKEQQLSLDPSRISGACGRLFCCLMYECETYQEMRKEMPREGTKVLTEMGEKEVINLNILKQTITVELEEGQRIEVPVEKLTRPGGRLGKRKESPRVHLRNFKPRSR